MSPSELRSLNEGRPSRARGQLGPYHLIAELARGGMGIVYLGLVVGPAGFNKLFVVKELKPHLAEDRELVTMFVEEARLSAKLSHPNVVQTLEVGCDDNRPFIAMEYLEGRPLHELLQRREDLPLPFHIFVLMAALEGLHHAHTLADFDGTPLSIVHRDVSPQNVFITYDGQTKVLDFGIAKALDSRDETRTGVLKGKIAYMAPEQAQGLPIDPRADVFSMGVMLWEAVAGRRMWAEASNSMAILRALMNGAVPRIRDACPDVPAALARIVDKATAVSASARYASAAEMQEDLGAYAAGSRSGAPLLARDLGKLLADTFADERAKMRTVIDAQVRVARADPGATHDLVRVEVDARASTTPTDFSSMRMRVSAATAAASGALPVAISQETPALDVARGKSRRAVAFGVGGALAGLFVALGTVSVVVYVHSRGTAQSAQAPVEPAPVQAAAPLGVVNPQLPAVASPAKPPAAAPLPVLEPALHTGRPSAPLRKAVHQALGHGASAPPPAAATATTETHAAHGPRPIDKQNPYAH